MSKRQGKYRLTLAAKEDIKEIWFYSVKNWGEKRAETYLYQLEDQFQNLAENPKSGRSRSDINNAYRSLSVGKHVIFYIIAESSIEIIGVPHCSMDIRNYFES